MKLIHYIGLQNEGVSKDDQKKHMETQVEGEQ